MQWNRTILDSQFLHASMVIAFILLFISFYIEAQVLFICSITFLLFGLLNKWYLTRVGERLTIENEKQTIKLFPGDHSLLEVDLKNEGSIPIINGNLTVTIDKNIECNEGISISTRQMKEVTIPFSISALEQQVISLPIVAEKRGVAKIRQLELSITHPIGFGKVLLENRQMSRKEIIIYPLPLKVNGIQQITPRSQGPSVNRYSLFEEHVPIGTREYLPSDPFNRINWKATARTTNLQTNILQRNALMSWTIVVNLKEGKSVIENLEEMASYLAFICQAANERDIMFELSINMKTHGVHPYIHLPIGGGVQHVERALDILARVTQLAVLYPIERVFMDIERSQNRSPVVIYCGADFHGEYNFAKRMQQRGTQCYRLLDSNGEGMLTKVSYLGNEGSAS